MRSVIAENATNLLLFSILAVMALYLSKEMTTPQMISKMSIKRSPLEAYEFEDGDIEVSLGDPEEEIELKCMVGRK